MPQTLQNYVATVQEKILIKNIRNMKRTFAEVEKFTWNKLMAVISETINISLSIDGNNQ